MATRLSGYCLSQTEKGKKLYISHRNPVSGEWSDSKLGYIKSTYETPECITWTLENGKQYCYYPIRN